MKEGWLLSIFILASITIAFSGYHAINYFEYGGGLTVDEYRACFSPDGFLNESYTYDVKSDFTMLYRVWDVPLLYNKSLNEPFVQLIDMNCSYIPYVKDYYGNVYSSGIYSDIIREKAYLNEAGCYNPDGYERGRYEIDYSYRIYPPVEYDGELYHMNIKFAGQHVPYKNFKIVLDNSSGTIRKIFSHPQFSIEKDGSRYILEGKSQKNGLLEVELLLNSSNQRFLYETNNVKEKTISANERYYAGYKIAEAFSYLMKGMVFLFPAILLLVYYLFGREKKFVVPKYLSFVPKKRKPWRVNLVFKGSATHFDKDGFYATLLDLHVRKIIEIENGDDIKIKILKKDGLDDYESKVVSFLERHSENGIFSLNSFKDEINEIESASRITALRNEMGGLYSVRDAKEFIINGRLSMAIFSSIAFLIFIISFFLYMSYFDKYPVLFESFSYSFLFFIQFLSTVSAPPTLFGRWKKEYYKEKMEWDSFRRFLLEIAQLKKYESKDISIWKEWLVYATALGAGKKVSKEFKKLGIRLPEADYIPSMYISFAALNATMQSKYSSLTSRSGGGGGGGFG
ncbi:MAG TPA: DUF2207 domain-containing protein, partial [Thermoplasmatales archaeon]|nr:DUF2207 domain-containing protein [Thermoplasmatales archaeon]